MTVTEPVSSNAGAAKADVAPSLLGAMKRAVLPFWKSRNALTAYGLAALLLIALFFELQVSLWNNALWGDLTNGVVEKDIPKLQGAVTALIGVLALNILVVSGLGYVSQFIMIRWRTWITDRLKRKWLTADAFYRLERERRIDNADQRIAEDAFILVNLTTTLFTILIRNTLRLIGFIALVVGLGSNLSLELIGGPDIPGGIVWLALACGAASTGVGLLIGRPLEPLSVEQQRRDADLRFALAGLRANAEQVALYEGEAAERTRVHVLLQRIARNWHRLVNHRVQLTVFNAFYSLMIMLFAMLVGFPQYLAGDIDYGRLMQIAGGFTMIINGMAALLDILVDGTFYKWAAAVRRLAAFEEELERPAPVGVRLDETLSSGSLIDVAGLTLAAPDGAILAAPITARFRRGERWLVRGVSGAGKSTFARAVAGLWPHGEGVVNFAPAIRSNALFLPQKSYLPTGALADALAYPGSVKDFPRAGLIDALTAVDLAHLVPRLDESAPWQNRLSSGEQQRIAFARAILHRPDVIVLDEATSAVQADAERALYALLDGALPDSLIISIAHSENLGDLHDHSLTILRSPDPEPAQ